MILIPVAEGGIGEISFFPIFASAAQRCLCDKVSRAENILPELRSG
jgi:hypothetical protein